MHHGCPSSTSQRRSDPLHTRTLVRITRQNTKVNTRPKTSVVSSPADMQELGWKIGESGNTVPGLEEGMMGMRKGELRRIIVPGEKAYNTEYIQSRKFEPQVDV